MKVSHGFQLLVAGLACRWTSASSLLSHDAVSVARDVDKRQFTQIGVNYCENGPRARHCWGQYSIETNYYDVIFSTGVTREFWLSIENSTIAPDGYIRSAMTVNGTLPGPALIVDWGDDVVVHVTNNLQHNGTAIHWHGVRQANSSQYDGVPGVTQCPIAPGSTMTYRWHATQYGTSWYHSHFSLQYGDGMWGPIVINGPATADYDVDLGPMHLSDWAHGSVFTLWDAARIDTSPGLNNALINGTNTFDCSNTTDVNCSGKGKKWETTFVPGKKYRLRLINSSVEGHYDFSIDGHKLLVISNDFVPIQPYLADSIVIAEGQRYDVIIEANAPPGDYWLRGGWQLACKANDNADDITGIIRYNANSTANPTSTGRTPGYNCVDEPLASLTPYLALGVGDNNPSVVQTVEADLEAYFGTVATWTFNHSTFYTNWTDPTIWKVHNNETDFGRDSNAMSVSHNGNKTWVALIIEDLSVITTSPPPNHPIHLHGHDYWILAQGNKTFSSNVTLNYNNPPRRDTFTLPYGGYLVLAFPLNNPGTWLMHCHIAWHISEGFALQFVESQKTLETLITEPQEFEEVCAAWDEYSTVEVYPQDDAGV